MPMTGTLVETIHPAPPYDFALTARASRFYNTLGAFDGSAYWRALRIGQGLALVRLAATGTPDRPAIDVYLMATRGEVDHDALRRHVRRILNLHLDLSGFYDVARRDERLWRVVESLSGLHIFQTETIFEALAITVLEQQISLAAAQRGERWLIEWAGDRIVWNGTAHAVFPPASRLAQASIADLTPTKVTFRRMRTVIDVARMEMENSFERLREQPLDDAYRALVSLSGVGHWTAAWTLARGTGHFIYFGSADVALRAAVNHYVYGQPGRCDAATTDAYFRQFGEHAGLAAYYTLMKWAFDRYATP
nr:MAG: hypothetical protein DIU68_04840 [Chloroflexota bacterium]